MFSWAERVILYNQYEIIKFLHPSEAEGATRAQEILASGLEKYYGQVNQSVSVDTIKKEICDEVEEIFNMYRAIADSCTKNNYTPKSSWAVFSGFDYNNDHDQTTVARYFLDIAGLWPELKDKPRNSHSRSNLLRYRLMVSAWKRLGALYELTPEQIEQIAEPVRRP